MDEENTGVSTTLVVVGGIGCVLVLVGFFAFTFLAGSAVTPTITPSGSTVTTIDGDSILKQTHREELDDGAWLEVVTEIHGTDLRKRWMRIESRDGGVEEFRGSWGEDGTLDRRASGHFVDGVRLGDLTPEKLREVEDWTE